MKDLERFKNEIAANIQDFVNKITPVFENFHTIEEVEKAEKEIDRAYEGGRKAIENTNYKLTENEKYDLCYLYDFNFSAVYDVINNTKYNINQGIQ